MRIRAIQTGHRVAGAILCSVLCAVPAFAHESAAPPAIAQEPFAVGALDTADNAPVTELNDEDRALLGKALHDGNFNFGGAAVRPLRLPGPIATKNALLDIARTDRPDGSGTVVVKKPLAPAWSEWDAKVGADLGLAANAPDTDGPYDITRRTRTGSGSGAAWASLGVPQFATVDARVDPGNETGRLGTTFTHALPLSGNLSVTLQSSYSVTETYGQPQTAPSNVPLMTPAPSAAAAPVPQVWGNSNVAKFDILPTGTTLAAGLSSTSTDPMTHNTLSAEQKLYGPLRVTTAVTDVGQTGESKSVSARLKLNW